MKDWVSCPLGELMVPKNDKAKQVKSTEYSPVGSYPIVDQSSKFICGFHDDEKKLISTNLPLTIFGDHTRHTKFISFPFIAGADGTQLLNPREALDDKFFFYLVSWTAGKIGNYGYDRHFKHLKEFHCDYPKSKPEQTKIAEILSTVDQAIEQTEALIAKQQRIKTGLMQDLLTRGIDEYGNLRSEQTHQFKDTPLGRIPVEWEVSSVSSVLTQPPKNGYSPVESGDWNGTYMLGLGCLTSEGFKPNQLKYAPKADQAVEAALLQHDDFLISRSNTRALVGMVGIYKNIREPCIYPDLMMRLRFDAEVSVDYMEQVFRSPAIRRQIENAATGTSGSMVKISASIIKGFLFRKPPIEEQINSLSIFQPMTMRILKMKDILAKFRFLKTALMQDLLTGKRRVTALLTEEASML